MDYQFKKYEPSMMSRLVALRVREWGEDPHIAGAYLSWMYEKNPYSDQTRIYVAMDEAKVIGMRGMSSGMLSGDSDRVPIVAATDTVVAPEHRGRHLFAALTRFALDDLRQQGYDYAVNLAGGRTTHLLSLRSGWVRVSPFQTLYWGDVPGPESETTGYSSRLKASLRASRLYPALRKAKAQLLRFKPRTAVPRHSAFQKLDARAAGEQGNGRTVVEKTPRPAQMAALVRQREVDDPRIRFVMDEPYYEWRFRDPRSDFRFLFAESTESQLAGFLVLLQLRSGHVAIVDWQYNDESVWLEMIRELLVSGNVSAASMWSATLPDTLIDGLKKLGFHPGPEVDTRSHPAKGLLLTSTDPDRSSANWLLNRRHLVEPEQWDLHMLFSDTY